MPAPAPVPTDELAPIPLREAAIGWFGAWLVGAASATALIGASGATKLSEAGPGWFAASAFVQWLPMLVVVWVLGRRYGRGDLRVDYGLRFRVVDLWGVPLGVVTQVVLIAAVYWPLRRVWPDTFDADRIEERARDLWDSTSGAGLVVLVGLVAIGAPLVEEIVYRGLLQGSLSRRLGRVLGLMAAALWFAAIHLQPIEMPGLFVAGLAFGLGFVLTGRLGMSILTHLAFNAVGLALAAGR